MKYFFFVEILKSRHLCLVDTFTIGDEYSVPNEKELGIHVLLMGAWPLLIGKVLD